MVDEADSMDPVASAIRSGAGAASGKRGAESLKLPPKRKVGPLPQHIVARRPSSPAPLSPMKLPVPPIIVSYLYIYYCGYVHKAPKV